MNKPVKRDVHGMLLLDKPIGMTSNAALQTVKRLYNARKAGHTGSLDPLASGLLPICFGEATKVSGFLLDAAKAYQFECRLGVTTTTADAEGEAMQTRSVPTLAAAGINEVLNRFTGEINQLPPMYSALKHQGKRLYILARQGIEVEREPRAVTIYRLELLDFGADWLRCQVECSKGTYIRTLAEDIGEALGCGAHITVLRRTGVTPYQLDQASSLDQLQSFAGQHDALDSRLLPVDSALSDWPTVSVGNDLSHYLRQGQAVIVPHAPTEGRVRLYQTTGDRFIGIGEILDDGRVAPRRLLHLP